MELGAADASDVAAEAVALQKSRWASRGAPHSLLIISTIFGVPPGPPVARPVCEMVCELVRELSS